MMLDLGVSSCFRRPVRSVVRPFPPVGAEVIGSPRSSVLWAHKTPRRPSLASPVSLDARYRGDGSPRRRRGLPGSWGIPVHACPGLGTPAARLGPRDTVRAMQPSARLTASAPATTNDFGAEPSRPACTRARDQAISPRGSAPWRSVGCSTTWNGCADRRIGAPRFGGPGPVMPLRAGRQRPDDTC